MLLREGGTNPEIEEGLIFIDMFEEGFHTVEVNAPKSRHMSIGFI